MKLTIKQQKFADEYIISGNIYNSLIKAGYSENYAKSRGYEMLENVGIKSYIDERLKEVKKANLLTLEEAMQITSDIARGKPMNIIQDDIEVPVYPTFNDRQKALEHFYKLQGAFVEKKEIKAEVKNKNIFENISTEEIKKLIGDG